VLDPNDPVGRTDHAPLIMLPHFHNKICQACHQRPAKIKFIKIIDGQWQEALICPVCAQSIANHEKAGAHLKYDHIQQAFLNPEAAGGGAGGPKMLPTAPGDSGSVAEDAMCPSCGLSFSNYRPTLMLGCSECYEAFGDSLRRDLRRIHGSDEHHGRRPPERRAEDIRPEPIVARESEAAARVAPEPAPDDFLGAPPVAAVDSRSEVRRLKRELAAAIEGEDFSVAANLRDRIRQLEEKFTAADSSEN
jgi:protein arginine kinase activator